ncbi:NFAT nuclear factor [Carabus blaptoides fortunei]
MHNLKKVYGLLQPIPRCQRLRPEGRSEAETPVIGTATTMKMTIATAPTMTQRIHHRKVLRLAGKRPGGHHHRSLALGTGKGRPAIRAPVDTACENSDDSGLGFDHHMDVRSLHYGERNVWADEVPDIKRRKLELKVENEETNDGYCFPESLKTCKENNSIIRSVPCSGAQNLGRNVSQNVNSGKNLSRCLPMTNRRTPVQGPVTLTSQLGSASRNGKVHLQIVCQPEQQHRARYQTEGSRGAVKDRTGNSFPIVKLIGYDKPTTLQIFIGTDLGRVAPHMFYQACRVSGKNSTPCVEKKVDGTIVIEIELEPAKEMIATCDCVGILKERNVDVEHRFPEQLSPRSKKKSTKCRMVFRTTITNDDGSTETLQVSSQPIVCTQPPGIPEICKKSLTNCPVSGGMELFILGKNFLKDTKVIFQQHAVYDVPGERAEVIWEEVVTPDKEFLQQTHLVCVVPPYMRQVVQDPVPVRLFVMSSGKNSEPHNFMYNPVTTTTTVTNTNASSGDANAVRMEPNAPSAAPFLSKMLWPTGTTTAATTVITGTPKQELDLGMMPPPTSLIPLAQRRPSTNMTLVDANSPPMRSMKTELIDENSQGSVVMDMMSENSMDMRHRFRTISENSLDGHHDDSSMTLINENSMDIMRRQDMLKSRIEAMSENSNSMHSFHCDKSNTSIHNDDSMESSRPADVPMFPQSKLMPHPHIQSDMDNSNLSRDDLKGIDLRMKTPMVTLNDLANTQPPSLATLRRFVVTESNNMPLPNQTGQSVENYLTTLENNSQKSVLSNTLASSALKNDNQLLLQTIKTSMFSSVSQPMNLLSAGTTVAGTPKLFTTDPVISNAQVLSETLLTSNSTSEILPNVTESHIKTTTSFDFSAPSLITTGPVMFSTQTATVPLLESSTEVLKQNGANMILAQQNLEAALSAGILQNATATPKLDALVNSAVETHIGSPINSPQQDLLIDNKSPLIPSSPQEILRQSPLLVQSDILISHTSPPDVILSPQAPLLTSALSPNELMIHSSQNELNVSPNALSPEVILNPQVSPSVICQDTLMQVNTICSPGIIPNNQIQSEILTADSEHVTSNALLSTLKPPPVSVESIVINAAVDFIKTQKKINQITGLDSHMCSVEQQKTQEQSLINTLLDVRNTSPNQEAHTFAGNQSQVMLQSHVTDLLKLSQSQFVNGAASQQNILAISTAEKQNEFLSQVNLDLQVTKQQQETVKTDQSVVTAGQLQKKNEEGMIPPALTNMSDHDLISYINPSCFDQV